MSAFSRGALPLAALHSIAKHVSVCAVCDSKVSTLVSDLEHKLTAFDQGAPPPTAAPSLDNAQIGLEGAHVDASGDRPSAESVEEPTAPLRLGQYRLMRQIGRGGMGVVYQARHERLQRDVAIKFVPIETIQDVLDTERLQREMAAAGTMRHPNVVYATDAGEAEGIQYLVMEYVQGIDLSKLVARIGPLPVADACEIIRQAAEGLAHVEQQKLVHRDLKPSNLMLAADGVVKILDLGLARVNSGLAPADELTRNGYLLGTIDYVAPEQARDAHSADIRSDIYSLGCTFFKLLTGGPPFGSQGHKSVASKILAHEHSPPPPLADSRPDVPPEVEAVVRRMLAKEPAERFQTPADLKRALKPLAASANLAALLERARIAPTPMPSATLADTSRQSTVAQSSDVQGKSAAAWRAPRSAVALAGVGIAAALCLVLGLLWFGGWLPTLPGIGDRGGKERPSPTVADILAAQNASQIDYPYSPEPHIGIQGQVTSPRPGELKLESEFIQLVRLGYLRDDAQRVSLSIDQPGEPRFLTGLVGIFLGYHEYQTEVANPKGEKQIDSIGELQLLTLHRLRDTPREKYLVAERKRAYIHPAWNPEAPHAYFESFVRSEQKIPLPTAGESLPVVIEFSGRGARRQIKRIAINGVELDDLVDPLTEVQFLPHHYEGTFGLYSEGNLGGAVFSNFDLSDLEKE